MAEERNRTRSEGSPTGAFPSIPESASPYEPPLPRTLPEVPNIPSATGIWPIVAEGEDASRQNDDSVSANAPDSEAASGKA